MAKPIVSTKVGPIPEIMENSGEGLLIENINSLGEATIRILKDKDLARRMGKAGRRLIEKFTPEIRATQVEEVYKQVISKR